MKVTVNQIRGYRLHAHHLDEKIPLDEIGTAAGACGLQNTPPGAWETALYNRVEDCTLYALNDALYNQKTLLQAWSYRGVPVIFPTDQSDIFLKPFIAREGEQPWVYTRGITGALDYLQMSFDDLLRRVKNAILYLDDHVVKSKEVLDQVLADIMQDDLPEDKYSLWRDPSMYGNPGKQTVGGAVVSFLLRPCSFNSLVVFGERQGSSPTFTSFNNWIGHAPNHIGDAEQELVRKFLHCYGPATMDYFTSWSGCSKPQAQRLWNSVSHEMTPVEV
ncbi:MAG: winged helix DNA-binding domain-containing protein, partial [Oscillospiraceae bacterium]|nr:winged helix DNA-binding domain-containing protein [Oscillospiraceae bacterium]